MVTREATYDFAFALSSTVSEVIEQADFDNLAQESKISAHWLTVVTRKQELANCKAGYETFREAHEIACAEFREAEYGSHEKREAKKDKRSYYNAMRRASEGERLANQPVTVSLVLPYDAVALRAALALGSCCPRLIVLLCYIGAQAKETTNVNKRQPALQVANMSNRAPYSSRWVSGDRSCAGDAHASLELYNDRLDGVMAYTGDQLLVLAGSTKVDLYAARQLRTFENPVAKLPLEAPTMGATTNARKWRGNLPIVDPKVDIAGGRPSRESCEAMWGVHVSALQQPRKVIDLLRDKVLPLASREWILVVKHALFQLGPLDGGRFLWRKDWQEDEDDSVAVLCVALVSDLRTLSSHQNDRS